MRSTNHTPTRASSASVHSPPRRPTEAGLRFTTRLANSSNAMTPRHSGCSFQHPEHVLAAIDELARAHEEPLAPRVVVINDFRGSAF
jgi:hypothetical protein